MFGGPPAPGLFGAPGADGSIMSCFISSGRLSSNFEEHGLGIF